VRSASGDDGRKLFQHVGHRGPVYKGLGAMNPCDNLHLHLTMECKDRFGSLYLIVHHAHEDVWGSRAIAPRFHKRSARYLDDPTALICMSP
jgi:hypothetical protein